MDTKQTTQAGSRLGFRVQVWSADQTKNLGYGRHMGEVRVKDIPGSSPDSDASDCKADTDPATEEAIEEIEDWMNAFGTTPRIVLDSGETIYGFQCYWMEVEEPSPSH